MKKRWIRIIGVISIGLLLSVPLVTFKIQDHQNINKKIAWQNSSLDKELMNKYPIINDIYNELFTTNDLKNYNQYVIKNKENYTSEQQSKLEEFQKLFEQEVNLLLQHQVIDHSLLELQPQEHYAVTFGTIMDYSVEDQGKYVLDQIYRFNTNNDNSISFTMNVSSKKITSFTISNQQLSKLTKEDIKKITWQMIEYLGLEKIEDWNYTDFGYESYQAKLQVICDLSDFSGIYYLNVSVGMAGDNRNLIIG